MKLKERFFLGQTRLDIRSVSPREAFIELSDFNVTPDIEINVYPHGFFIGNINMSLLHFAKSGRVIIAGLWHRQPELHYWN